MIIYKKADLVTANPSKLIDEFIYPSYFYKLHACNCLGKWGRGIAAAFRDNYPGDYKEYQEFCTAYRSVSLGESFITRNSIVCLMTSFGYNPPDSEQDIISATSGALSSLGYQLPTGNVYIFSNRFNSGLFKVPWEKTEALIEEFLKIYPNVTWTVCDL